LTSLSASCVSVICFAQLKFVKRGNFTVSALKCAGPEDSVDPGAAVNPALCYGKAD
jgi:hypothetical protein